ncbi:MAG: hypothetical protein ACI9EW_003004 [Cellvibrionaceae bacterium]|jgi:hypothetical protein
MPIASIKLSAIFPLVMLNLVATPRRLRRRSQPKGLDIVAA